jgi:CubicO group peptidase (beta-lactamase class C family)
MRNFFLNGITARMAVIAVFLFAAFSCSRESIIPEEPGKSDNNQLVSFTFYQSENPSLAGNCTVYRNGDIVYVTVPEGAEITSLKPAITIPSTASLSVDGNNLEGVIPFMDFSGTVRLTVTSESGKAKIYRILVQEGVGETDRLIYSFMTKYSIPGVALAISKQEEIVYSKGFGFAIEESDERTKNTHLFRLASISKQFTTLCIMKLYEEGKLSLDDKVFGSGAILEEEFESSMVSDKAARVTVKHLLQHTSGWSSNPDPMFSSSFEGQSLDKRIEYVLTSTQKEPGTQHSYFNMGFGILGRVIEKLSGKSYGDYLAEVVSLAGVSDVHIGGDRYGRRENEVVYYSQSGTNGYANDMDVIAAAGGLISSVEEMSRILFHIDDRKGVPDIILPATRSVMLEPSTVNPRYAMGWRTNHPYYPNSWYHGGNLSGTAVMWVMGPTYNCIVLCNSRSYIDGFDDEMYGLLKDIINKAYITDW